MRSSKQSEAKLTAPVHPAERDAGRELSTAWDSLSQTKAALRHIENRLEAAPSTSVLLDSVMDTKKTSSSATRKISRKDGRHLEDSSHSAPSLKAGSRGRARRERGSRSPLRATTLESNVKKASGVEFRDPLVTYRDPIPPHVTQSLLSELPSSTQARDDRLSRLIYQSDTRDLQCRDFDSTRSSAVDSTVVRYLNDLTALEALHTSEMPSNATEHHGYRDCSGGVTGEPKDEGPCPSSGKGQDGAQAVESSQSSSPGSASQRLENLRRRQHDNKLEKLKERIRKQREHSEEAAERERLLGHLDQPVEVSSTETAAPTAKIRKVATAPPAPTYKGFNPSETKIRTADGKVWREEDFQNLSREIYRDLSLQLTDCAKSKDKPAEKGKDKKSLKPVRKIHKAARSPSPDAKPGHIISTASWREGQKLVKMVLGPAPKTMQEQRAESADRSGRTGLPARTTSETRLESRRRLRASSAERPRSRAQSEGQLRSSQPKVAEDKLPRKNDFLSAEIQGILDDLQLESRVGQSEHRRGSRGPGAGASSRLSRSASPAKRKQEGPKKRHYDADSVRQYIARQQEERRKRQVEEKRAQKEEAERKNKRLQELYRKQKESFAKARLAPEGPAQKRLQDTYSKLLAEHDRLEGLPQSLPVVNSLQPKPLYQPSGESDKENKGQDRPQSASSSSDLSLSEPRPPPLDRSDLAGASWMQPDRLSPAGRGPVPLGSSAGGLFTQLLGLESGLSSMQKEGQTRGQAAPFSVPGHLSKVSVQNKSKINRIEALKATAASLSTRIESEARKLAGAGINYGSVRDLDTDVLPAGQHDNGRWAKSVSPPVRESSDPGDLSVRIQRLLSAGHTAFDGALPGVGNLHDFKRLRDPARPQSVSTGQVARASEEEEEKGSIQDSSADSISEGPLLSEGSLSDMETSHLKGVPRPADHLKSREFCVAEKNTFRPISHFQKEAENYPAFSSVSETVDRGPWEELAKGSPHSVINIFTKSLQTYGKVLEEKLERSSPALQPLPRVTSSPESASYEDDFVSSQSSGSHSRRRGLARLSNGSSASSPQEEFPSHQSPCDSQAPEHISHHSSVSTLTSSPQSSSSSRKRGGDVTEESTPRQTLLDEDNSPSSQGSEPVCQDRRASPGKMSPRNTELSPETNGCAEDSLGADGKRSPRYPASSPSGSPTISAAQKTPPAEASSVGADRMKTAPPVPNSLPSSSVRFKPTAAASAFTEISVGTDTEPSAAGSLQFSPSALQQRMTAELSYLDAMEESVRQLSDVERVRGISLAQQESVSLAQILKAQQQRHERDLYLLKLKAEQEALDSQRQLEETRQKAAQAHAESQQMLAQSQQEALGGLQDATSRMIAQQAEAVRYTADAAWHIKEMTELARSQIASAMSVPAAPITALYDQQRQHHSSFMKQLRSLSDLDSNSDGSPLRMKTEEHHSSLDSYSESSHSKTPSNSSSQPASLSVPSMERKEKASPVKDERGSSVEEEIQAAADDSVHSDSVPSLPDEKDTISVATEYSLKFDESMTEDEIEEKSFRSLLPSESHRRFTLEKKRDPHEDSDDEPSQDKATLYAEGRMPFSSGQDSFSKFTMDMVRQYMKEEEVRAQHQSSLLRLREKALKEKTKAELAWLEHQKRRLRDKGEDDKMPPIRKRQRGLLLKLQQEQAEIKRLQEANKAARRERQLLLKQQEEIARMRHTTMKLQEKLKSAGDINVEAANSDTLEEELKPSPAQTDLETRSPSPLSVSGSETSSIMQKLKKMRSHMDEKHCSPVHYFFSVFTSHHWASLSVCFPNLHPKFQLFIYNQLVRFLTKREQQLVQRRRHAEELLEWKRRLDEEEAEVRRMEKEALAVWDRQLLRDSAARREPGHSSPSGRVCVTEPGSEEEGTAVETHFSPRTDLSIPEEVGSPPAETPVSELPTPDKETSLQDSSAYSQDFESPSSHDKTTASSKANIGKSKQDMTKSSSGTSRMQVRSVPKPCKAPEILSDESPSITETTSDQSDIESRIRALKEELRRRKSIVYQLKKEQKKRHKERLKAQEASLLKQLESYNDFINKTKAELDKEPDTSPTTKPQIKTPSSVSGKPKIKPPPLQRCETNKTWKIGSESEKSPLPDSPAKHDDDTLSSKEKLVPTNKERPSNEEPTITVSPIQASPETVNVPESLTSPEPVFRNLSTDAQIHNEAANTQEEISGDESAVSSQRSEIVEELEQLNDEESDSENLHSQSEDLHLKHLGLLTKSQDQSAQKEELHDHNELTTAKGMDLEKDASIGEKMEQQESAVDGGEEDEGNKSSISSEPKKSEKPTIILAEEHEGIDLPLTEMLSAVRQSSYSPDIDALSPEKEMIPPENEEYPPVECYWDDFESSSESSSLKDSLESKAASIEKEGEERSQCKSPASISEEVSEELSEKSSSTSGSFHSGRLLELTSQADDLKGKESSNREQNEVLSPVPSSPNSRPHSPTTSDLDLMSDFNLGDRVLVSSVQPGTLRFKGKTIFANGFWAGVELDKSEGSNNGTYDGVVYFKCKEGHGIFAPPDKITRLPDTYEMYVDTTEDEDSFLDDQCDGDYKGKDGKKDAGNEQNRRDHKREQTEPKGNLRDSTPTIDDPEEPPALQNSAEKDVELNDLELESDKELNEGKHLILNGRHKFDLDMKTSSVEECNLLNSEVNRFSKEASNQQEQEKSSTPLLDLLAREKDHLEVQLKPLEPDVTPEVQEEETPKKREQQASTFADRVLNNFMRDAVKQIQQIKKARNEKIALANQKVLDDFEEEPSPRDPPQQTSPSEVLKDSASEFLDEEGDGASSPELCARPESPVFGASGQEELAKRLAELELSRELLDVLGGDEQDWFDEDFGLSSRKEQQRQQQQGGPAEQAAAASRPEPPSPAKPREEPLMVVPHVAPQVERLVHMATDELWKFQELGHSVHNVSAPAHYLGNDTKGQDIESISRHSYKQSVFDLTKEIFQEIFAEDPNANQPQWRKPRRLNSSYYRRVKNPNNISEVKAFITAEVLKLFGLKKDQNQKTDWQKMLKFGRKKRDRVDHILVQELHEEESQWVNYDEDELFVKMQLADGIFDALLKDTIDVLNQLQDRKAEEVLS
nr:PREDICTED: centrosome-associated protein 350 isoform X2 [Lepisosteus oculatus]